MPSRKKSKGQARKAAAAAASSSSQKQRYQRITNKCIHGSHSAPSPGCSGEACGEFIRTLYESFIGAVGINLSMATDACTLTQEKFPEIWNNDINRNTVISYITREGTNHLLMERPELASICLYFAYFGTL